MQCAQATWRWHGCSDCKSMFLLFYVLFSSLPSPCHTTARSHAAAPCSEDGQRGDGTAALIAKACFFCSMSSSPSSPLPATPQHGATLLHHAVRTGNVEMARLLLQKGADVNAADQWGWTPMHVAAQSGRIEMVRALLVLGGKTRVQAQVGER
ncbi:unnamed protein product [Closterium sp. NIES-54]